MEKLELILDFGKCKPMVLTCFVLKRIGAWICRAPLWRKGERLRLEPVQRYRHYDDNHKAFNPITMLFPPLLH